MVMAGAMKQTPPDGEADPAGAAATEHHRQLGGARAGEHADRAEEVEELVIVEPVAPPDRFVAQHGDMARRGRRTRSCRA